MQCLQLMVASYGDKPITAYRNVFLNLALPFFAFQEPMPCSKDLWKDEEILELKGNVTAAELVEWVKACNCYNIHLISCRSIKS